MPSQQALENWRRVSDFFLGLEIRVEEQYFSGEITKKERNKKLKKLNKLWDYNVFINNPVLAENSRLHEVAERFFERDNLR